MFIATGLVAAKSVTHTAVLAARIKMYRAITTVNSASDADGLFNEAKSVMTTWVSIGGGLWLVWGVVIFASALDDQNGPDMKRGMWKIIGGAMIIVAAQIFRRVG